MEKRNQRNLWITVKMIALFILWTVAVRCFDVQAIGPRESSVGFATLNRFFHNFTGVHLTVYTITDWLGFVQLIKRRSLWKVDHSILALGGYYVLVMAVYILFEVFAINYRPVLINGYLEASYPSSTTMLVLCVIPTAIMQLKSRMKNNWTRKAIVCILIVFSVLMVVGRLLSGVHWFTDIVGGILLSAGLVMSYSKVVSALKSKT